MILKVKRYGLEIVPENDLDVAYIEEVLALKKDGDMVGLHRHNIQGLGTVGYLATSEPRKG